MFVGIGQTFLEEAAPLVLAELDAVEGFQSPAKIGNQLFLAVSSVVIFS